MRINIAKDFTKSPGGRFAKDCVFYRNRENTLLIRPRMHELNVSKAMPLDAFKSKIRELVSKYEKDRENISQRCLLKIDKRA